MNIPNGPRGTTWRPPWNIFGKDCPWVLGKQRSWIDIWKNAKNEFVGMSEDVDPETDDMTSKIRYPFRMHVTFIPRWSVTYGERIMTPTSGKPSGLKIIENGEKVQGSQGLALIQPTLMK